MHFRTGFLVVDYTIEISNLELVRDFVILVEFSIELHQNSVISRINTGSKAPKK